MDKIYEDSFVISNIEISNNIFEMIISNEYIANNAKPGQFITVYCTVNSKMLPRQDSFEISL